MSDFQHFSKKLKLVFQTCLFLTPLFTILFWLNPEQTLAMIGFNPFGIPKATLTFNMLSQLLGFSISLIPTAIVMVLFYNLVYLFNNYQQGKVFNPENVSCYKKLGKYLFLLACSNFITHAFMTAALSFQNTQPGERFVAIAIGTPQVLPILIGLVIVGISYVMQEALRLDEDVRFTI